MSLHSSLMLGRTLLNTVVPPAGAFQGHCCASGNICKRQNEWYWGCTPGTKSLSLSTLATIMGALTPSASPVDMLAVAAPAVAAAGQPLQLTASLTRGGQPVEGAEVEFTVRTAANISSDSVCIRAITDAGGVAVAVVPAESAGGVGSSSLVSAITPDGKAVGVKGTIAVRSEDIQVAWQ